MDFTVSSNIQIKARPSRTTDLGRKGYFFNGLRILRPLFGLAAEYDQYSIRLISLVTSSNFWYLNFSKLMAMKRMIATAMMMLR